MNLSQTTDQMISKDAMEDNGILFGAAKVFHPFLNPGTQLDTLNRKSVKIIADSLSKIAARGSTTINMFEWVSNLLLTATTEGVYGPQNPFRDPGIIAARS